MAEQQFEGGVRRAAEMVDDLTGDTESFLAQMAEQLEATVTRNEQLRDGLVAQVERLEGLLAYQRGQLSLLQSAAEGVPHDQTAPARHAPQAEAVEDVADVERVPEAEADEVGLDAAGVDLDVDVGDTTVSYGERVLRVLAEQQEATLDELVQRLVEAGDSDATRRKVSTSVTNLRRAGRVERVGDVVRLAG
ncbi:MAG: hypothetical protein KY462_16705 [Actinobacteria bacterium]|nr:hypothetical protein [Actinomycetota bacterium]